MHADIRTDAGRAAISNEEKMITHNKLARILAILFVAALTAGCAAPIATLAPIPTLPPIPTIPTPAPPLQTVKPTGESEVFTLLRTVEVTPDDVFLDAQLYKTQFRREGKAWTEVRRSWPGKETVNRAERLR
jgi:hypothetical protein